MPVGSKVITGAGKEPLVKATVYLMKEKEMISR